MPNLCIERQPLHLARLPQTSHWYGGPRRAQQLPLYSQISYKRDSVKTSENTAQVFEQYRFLLFSIAYRMLGSATDAEDIIQEAFLRWLQASAEEVRSPKAYLTTVVVRLCIDQLRERKARREVYFGSWLPEPATQAQYQELFEHAELAESLSF